MSCVSCEVSEEKGDVAYVRVDRANVGLIGCDQHVRKILDMLDAVREMEKEYGLLITDSGRPVVRVKKQT